jgi:mRNA interferase RelE/StbE
MTVFRVIVKHKAEKELGRLPQHYQRDVLELLRALSANPVPRAGYDIDHMEGSVGVFRVRLGDIRVVYKVDEAVRVVTVIRVATRGRVY